ncbi:30S ribosomal protein S7 [Candidatus Woesearchaeota archaeon]|nr:30S ribosomal protein S7 [Candidatus Woesearchaeota archaeon]
MSEIKFFNRWTIDKVAVNDKGLVKYLNVEPRVLPKTGGRHAANRFHKSYTSIVERLVVKVMNSGHKAKKHFMSSGHNTGKKFKALKIVELALVKAEMRLKMNPLAALVKAVENAAPREEVIAIEYGGARYPKAVDVAPQRRIDIALRYMTQGAYQKSFNKKMKIEDALAEEIISAAQCSAKSNAVAKKRDLERQAASSK